MNQEIRQEMKDTHVLLASARGNITKAWIAGNKREQNSWTHYADMIEARMSYLLSIANKGA